MTTQNDDQDFARLRSKVQYAIQGTYRHDNNCVYGGYGLVVSVSGGMSYDDVINTAEYLAEASPKTVTELLRQFDELREDYQATTLRANANAAMHTAAEEDCMALRARVAELEARLANAGL
jgi:hypothetical protein